MTSHNYNKRRIRPVIKEIGIGKLKKALESHGISTKEPLANFCLERNQDGEFLQHIPTKKLILDLAGYAVPKYGWTMGGNYNQKN